MIPVKQIARMQKANVGVQKAHTGVGKTSTRGIKRPAGEDIVSPICRSKKKKHAPAQNQVARDSGVEASVACGQMTTNSDENDASRSSIYPVASQQTISGDEIHSIQEHRSSLLIDPVPESSGSRNNILGNQGVIVPAAITAQPLFEKTSNPSARGAQKKGQTYLDENQTRWRINNNPPEKEERHQLTTLTNLLNAAEISDGTIKELQGELMTGQTWINGVIIHGSGKCMMEWLMRLEAVERWNSMWSQLLCLRLCAIWTK
ncbi:hypothetical protein K439DRAFT_1622642 [Ramaria rubella]|nr:hypothetical protein K439DRAFT_1622642 [Ramaria rubella]